MIETPRLLLRDFAPSDADAFWELTSDPKYQRFYSEADSSEQKARELVNMFAEQAQQANRTQYQMAIELKETSALIGTAGLRIEADQQASVGCGVGRPNQSAGYAEEAMAALLDYGFNTHNLHRVYAETIADNKAAIKLCKKLGMREEARFIENRFFKGRWWSTVVMAMLQSEWTGKGYR